MSIRPSNLPTTGTRPRLAWLSPLLALSMFGCPKQELAPLGPCTVAAVSERVDQSGVADVDLLFVIDNSASMASEQVKLAQQLPNLVRVLTSGDRYKGREDQVPEGLPDERRFFTAVKTMHLGVVSTNLGGIDDVPNNQPENIKACGGNGDNAVLLNNTEVAANGQGMIPPVAGCEDIGRLPQYQVYEAGGDLSSDDVTQNFSCVSALGINGCPFEQQLEAMWKALAPSDGLGDPDLYEFLNGTSGQSDRDNEGFLRPNAILTVLIVSDEEDCSITDEGKRLFAFGNKRVNLLCGEEAGNPDLVRPVQRYIDGLKSLKPDNPDRIIFGAIVGVPEDAIEDKESIDEILDREDMQFVEDVESGKDLPKTSCSKITNGQRDDAYPPRRMLQVAKPFDDLGQAVIYSICADDYSPALEILIDKIASKLKGNCLPRQLNPGADGTVDCEVWELLPDGEKSCSEEFGLSGSPVERTLVQNNKTVKRLACKMEQVPVLVDGSGRRAPKDGEVGWYYDNFNESLMDDCPAGDQQRISFTFKDLPQGAGATFECFQPVARIDADAVGFEAVNTNCEDNGGPDDGACEDRSNEDYKLFCLEGLLTCQIKCEVNPQCPPGWVCDKAGGGNEGPTYCQLPTCPQDTTAAN